MRTYSIYSCLAALRRSYSDASERDYRSTVTNWLDRSKDRNGGRKRRSESHAIARDETDFTEKTNTLVYLMITFSDGNFCIIFNLSSK